MTVGDVWEKTGASAWTARGNIRGPQGSVATPVRTNLTLTNSWTNYSDVTNYATIHVLKAPDGTCTLHGLVQNTALTEANYAAAIATIPAGLRPAMNFAVPVHGIALDVTPVAGPLRLSVNKDGTIVLAEAYLPQTLLYLDCPSWVGV